MDELASLRERIDGIDRSILELLARRFEAVREVGEYKKARGLPPLAPERWRQVLDSRRHTAVELGLGGTFVEDIWNRIHEHALRIESEER